MCICGASLVGQLAKNLPAMGGTWVRFEIWSICKASLVARMVKNTPAKQETQVRSLGWEDPLEKGKATSWGRKESDMAEKLSL